MKTDEMFGELRRFHREHMHMIWEVAKTGDLDVLEAKEPIETYQFYNSMRKQKVSHHDTVHLVDAILAPLILNTLQQRRAFDLEKYKSLLKKCKGKKPEKIMEWLDRDPEW